MSVPSEADRTEMLERLTAYLDGELDAADASEVERRLSAEPTWAAELQRLQRAWDLLDRLPRAEVGANFTHTTVEMIAVEAEDHYLRVHTNAGDELITARFGDALKELAKVKGFRTHRSWWVAAGAIDTVRWLRGRGEARLKCGLVVPISRSQASELKAAGWF